jgi:hypothetical protein
MLIVVSMYVDLNEDQIKLSDLMSDISEKAYHAQWIHNLEYVLWNALLNGERKYGHYVIKQAEIDSLVMLSKVADSWIYFDDEMEETALSIDEWKEKFKKDIDKNPGLIYG